MITFTQRFFQQILEKHPESRHKCRHCGIFDGERPIVQKGKNSGLRMRNPAVVRLALINPEGPANRADNVGYYCLKCRPEEKHRPKRLKPSELPQLFK
jgi:hypothetical protein